ncbi:hypothetical protein PDJAM_G00236390 [Pangasius djambal]|uniref:Uncharacterized protein n=1 Tax=Pangasius djambal TaxID=1691987 RepID=A0ACC5YGS0_9TELE|nr:hypothetical protein [Pangasius djambal]
MKDVLGFLKLQQGKTPEIAAEWHTLEDLYNRKLWHQLTLRLSEFVQNPCVCKGDGLVQLYENFISDFEHRINPLSLVEILLHVQERAFTLGLAGLLGEGVYNFGELLMHPVLESLKNTDKQWLIETLYAFNSGNVEKFQALKSAWGQQPDLAAQEAKLMQKIQLLCVMEMTFTRPANHRQLTFQEISQSTRVPVNEFRFLNDVLLENVVHSVAISAYYQSYKSRIINQKRINKPMFKSQI